MLGLHALSDPGVARIKLQWWLEQISLPLTTPSNHPLAKQLSTLYHGSDVAAEAFNSIASETDRHLHRMPYQEVDDLWQGCINFGGSFAKLMQSVSGLPIDHEITTLGAWISFVEWLQTLGQLTRNNIKLLPVNLLKQHEINYERLLQSDQQQIVHDLLQELVADINSRLSIPQKKRPKTPLNRYLHLRHKLFDLLLHENLSVMHQRISLTPIRKLWFAL